MNVPETTTTDSRQSPGITAWLQLHAVIMVLEPMTEKLTGPEKVQRLRSFARIALARSAQLSGIAPFQPVKDAQGVPQPVNAGLSSSIDSPSIHWSLSHTKDCVAAVVAPGPVGIDVEWSRPISDNLKNKAATAAEWELPSMADRINTTDQERFLTFWTAKEAVLKATGVGLAGLSRCSISREIDAHSLAVNFRGDEWHVQNRRLHGAAPPFPYTVAVTAGDAEIIWHIIR